MRRSKRLLVSLTAVGVLWLSPAKSAEGEPELADPVEEPQQAAFDEAIVIRGQANTELAGSQERIEKLSDATDDLLTLYQSALPLAQRPMMLSSPNTVFTSGTGRSCGMDPARKFRKATSPPDDHSPARPLREPSSWPSTTRAPFT